MRQSPRHITPGGDTLRSNERRDIVEYEHGAGKRAVLSLQRGRGRSQMKFPPIARQGNLLRRRFARNCLHSRQQPFEWTQIVAAEHFGGRATDDICFQIEQSERRGIDRFDSSVGAHRDHPGRDSFEHGFDVAAPLVELQVLALEIHS